MGSLRHTSLLGAAAALLLLLLHVAGSNAAAAVQSPGSLAADTQSLLDFKSSLGDPTALSSWTAGSSPCNTSWVGVSCAAGRVAAL